MSLSKRAADKFAEAQAKLQNGELEAAKNILAEAKSLKEQADVEREIMEAKSYYNSPNYRVSPPVEDEAYEPELAKSIMTLRNEDVNDTEARILREVYGSGDYRQHNIEEMKAFNEFLRGGKVNPQFTRQRWSKSVILDMVKKGLSMSEIKATMVEGQDTLGGYAVPAELSERIIQRSAGLTAVRAAGATVLQTASSSVEFVKFTGGNSRYTTALRGAWGNETKNPPAETNMTLGLETVPVHTYTFKTPMSQSLIEDARNLVGYFETKVSEALAIDEDEAFLTGLGTNKPKGLLPGGNNTRSLTEVNSASGSALTYAGLKRLPRGINTQYRQNNRASWIANSSTASAIETLVDSEGRFFVNSLNPGEAFMRSRWLESEAMPNVGANTFPIIYGDFSGYIIVERLGLSVQRYNDSYTGSNLVEFHVRRRIGGDVLEDWKFAVQKVAA